MRAFLDACVLYPTVTRRLLLDVAKAGVFVPLWSERVLEEWRRAAIANAPELEEVTRGEVALEQAFWPDAMVAGVPSRTEIALPDPNDIHVVEAALAGQADVLVTANLKDFPVKVLGGFGLRVSHPDVFLSAAFEDAPEALHQSLDAMLSQARTGTAEAFTPRKFLKKARLPRLAKQMERE